MYTVASFFSGCSGSDLGFKLEGFDIEFATDWNQDACATYRENIGPILNAPVAALRASDIPDADIYIGGPPCQSFSNARSNGYKGGYRSLAGLEVMLKYISFVREQQPKLFICENAPTLMQHSMVDITNNLVKLMTDCGYKVRPYLVSAEDCGVPQQRERTFFLGVRNDLKGVFRPSLPDSWKNHWNGWADYLGLPNEGLLIRRGSSLKGKSPFESAYTVISAETMCIRYEQPKKMHGKLLSVERTFLNQRYLTVREIARLQGFPADYQFVGLENSIRLQIANAWCVDVARMLAREAKGVLDAINVG